MKFLLKSKKTTLGNLNPVKLLKCILQQESPEAFSKVLLKLIRQRKKVTGVFLLHFFVNTSYIEFAVIPAYASRSLILRNLRVQLGGGKCFYYLFSSIVNSSLKVFCFEEKPAKSTIKSCTKPFLGIVLLFFFPISLQNLCLINTFTAIQF